MVEFYKHGKEPAGSKKRDSFYQINNYKLLKNPLLFYTDTLSR